MLKMKTALCATLALLGAVTMANAQTLKAVKDRGSLVCGVSQGLPGFSQDDGKGNWSGFDVDFCRALAAAIFNDPKKVTYVPLNAAERFDALKAGKIDILSRNSTWTLGREAEGITFAGVTYYDGQGFMLKKRQNLMTSMDLSNVKICVQEGTTTELNLTDYFNQNGMRFEIVKLPNVGELLKAYESGKCEVISADVSQLYALRLELPNSMSHTILADVISKEPLGPVVRQGDEQWFNIVKWVHFAMLNADELGVHTAKLDDALKSEKADLKRLLGRDGDYGEKLGLTRDWVVRIVRHVGSYGDVYERNIGMKSKVMIPRGLNQLWSTGGIQYAPPIR
ncbi:MAG: amino acid ABC transporter substrate-binding protein [Xanthobacteraceae bacterium]|nr:amino acid ABC transporter substrate-binding protein [Xanthobacteraceae bacterium]MBX3547583.1 amino acid ABC transporter substrate-binding protein [Xanthobacteraceae bacterium]MCW5677296.1 amino acid ABC transporter substrate-binding protein [Xanthobacteraceae bacterium]